MIVRARGDAIRAEAVGYYPERSFLLASCGGGIVGVDPPSCVVRRDVRIRPLPDLASPSLAHCTLRGTVYSPGQPRSFGEGTAIVARANLGSLADSLSTYRIPEVPTGLYWVDANRIGSPSESRLVYVQCTAEQPWVELDFQLSITVIY
ncbi:MAG: hypothetical protein KJO44_00555 [Gemmatimonadetes bacterium]|nr:hypothetical protein [Gemmatimonadota bacterium]